MTSAMPINLRPLEKGGHYIASSIELVLAISLCCSGNFQEIEFLFAPRHPSHSLDRVAVDGI